MFHRDRSRRGWVANVAALTPASVSSGRFGPLWNSQILDPATVNGSPQLPHIYASPLYVDDVLVTAHGHENLTAATPKSVAEVEALCAR